MSKWSPVLPPLNNIFASSSALGFQNGWQQVQTQGFTKAQLQQQAQQLQAKLGFVPPQLTQFIAQFDSADTNKDGTLSAEELTTQAQANYQKNPFAVSIAQQTASTNGISNPFAYIPTNNGSFQLGQQGLTGISTLQNTGNTTKQYSASSDRLTNLISQFGTTTTASGVEEDSTSSSLL